MTENKLNTENVKQTLKITKFTLLTLTKISIIVLIFIHNYIQKEVSGAIYLNFKLCWSHG